MDMIYILAAIAGLLLLLYTYLTWNYDFWKKHGIPYLEPQLLFGNIKRVLVNQENIATVYDDFYWKYPNEPAIGAFLLRQPQLIIRDLELAKNILIKDFSSFHDNDFFVDKNVDAILALNPFMAKGDDWKELRSLHSQNLTSAKVKNMVPMIKQVSTNMVEYARSNQGVSFDTKEFSGHFTLDNVGICVYGLNTNSFKNPDSEFRKISLAMFEPGFFANIGFLLASVAPVLLKVLKIRLFPQFIFDYVVRLTKEMSDYKLKNNLRRSDYLQLLMDSSQKQKKPFSIEEIGGHTLTFFLDGYETSATTMGFLYYLLALHPDVQEKLFNELRSVEEIDFDTVHKLEFLDCVLNETLRLFPPGTVLHRICTSDITLKSGKRSYPLKKGMSVRIPIYSLHRDPKYFTDPEKFNPDRFLENPNLKSSPAFYPFGGGPRACLGQRFAITQVKVGIATLLKEFKVIPAEPNAKMPKVTSSSPVLLVPEEKMMVKLEAW